MAEFDTAALVASIIRDAKVPEGSSYTEAAVLLGIADEQLRTLIVPELLKAPGDMLAARASLPLVSGRSAYRLPPRNLRVLGVRLLDGDGRPVDGFGRASEPQAETLHARPATGCPRWWYLEASGIRLHPTPDDSGVGYTLAVRYARRPSRLVEPTSAWAVSSVGGSSFATEDGPFDLTAGTVLDVVKGTPGFECLVEGGVLGGAPGAWTVTGLSVGDLEAGDVLCERGASPLPQIPADYHPVLAQAVVAHILKEQGDTQGESAARQRLAELLATAQPIIEPRAEEAEVCVSHSWL